jgi:hypothetical protein
MPIYRQVCWLYSPLSKSATRSTCFFCTAPDSVCLSGSRVQALWIPHRSRR